MDRSAQPTRSRRENSRSPKRRRYSDDDDDRPSKRTSRVSISPKRRGPTKSRAGERSRRDRSRSPRRKQDSRSPRRYPEHSRRPRSRSRSPRRSKPRESSRSPPRRSRKPLVSQAHEFGDQDGGDGPSNALDKPPEKQKPNYKPSGLLAAESNKVTVSGGSGKDPKAIILKYHEPPEARKPPSSQLWSCYIFKGDAKDPLDTIPLHTRSCWLLGRETTVADIPTEHPSCSKQHAVFQFRYITKKDQWGEKKGKVGLYLIDLESANGTFLNGEKVEPARYVECLNSDVVKFGESEREYVILLPSKE